MAREKTGGVQKGFKKYGEERAPIGLKVPATLLNKFYLFPGTKTDKLINAITNYITNMENLRKLLQEQSGQEWTSIGPDKLYCEQLWGEPEVTANVTVVPDNRYQITIPSTSEIFELEDLIEFVQNKD